MKRWAGRCLPIVREQLLLTACRRVADGFVTAVASAGRGGEGSGRRKRRTFPSQERSSSLRQHARLLATRKGEECSVEFIKPRPELKRAHEPSHRAKRIRMRTDPDENEECGRA